MKKDLKRVGIYMSPAIHEFYVKMAKEMGVSISAAMVIGLKSYQDQQLALTMNQDLNEMIQFFNSVKGSMEVKK